MDVQSCWICGDKKTYCPVILKMLKVPDGMKLVSMVAVGYNEDTPIPTPKRPLDEVLHWETF
jgi:nitroreductase